MARKDIPVWMLTELDWLVSYLHRNGHQDSHHSTGKLKLSIDKGITGLLHTRAMVAWDNAQPMMEEPTSNEKMRVGRVFSALSDYCKNGHWTALPPIYPSESPDV